MIWFCIVLACLCCCAVFVLFSCVEFCVLCCLCLVLFWFVLWWSVVGVFDYMLLLCVVRGFGLVLVWCWFAFGLVWFDLVLVWFGVDQGCVSYVCRVCCVVFVVLICCCYCSVFVLLWCGVLWCV